LNYFVQNSSEIVAHQTRRLLVCIKGNHVFYSQVEIHGSFSSLNTVAFPQDVPKYLTSIEWKGLEN